MHIAAPAQVSSWHILDHSLRCTITAAIRGKADRNPMGPFAISPRQSQSRMALGWRVVQCIGAHKDVHVRGNELCRS
jgi:hypothetical protein